MTEQNQIKNRLIISINCKKRLRRNVGNAQFADFGMIEDGDKVMVCLSGGKDSYTLLDILLNLQQSAPIKFDIVAVNLDQNNLVFGHVYPEYLQSIGVDYKIVEENTYGIVKRKFQKAKQRALSALAYAVVFYTVQQQNLVQQNCMVIIVMICYKPVLNMFYGGRN